MANTNGNSSDRMDRVERILEFITNTQADIKSLYVSPVVNGETVNKIAEAQREMARAQREMIQAQKEMIQVQKQADAHMDALILTVDEIIRGRKRE